MHNSAAIRPPPLLLLLEGLHKPGELDEASIDRIVKKQAHRDVETHMKQTGICFGCIYLIPNLQIFLGLEPTK